MNSDVLVRVSTAVLYVSYSTISITQVRQIFILDGLSEGPNGDVMP